MKNYLTAALFIFVLAEKSVAQSTEAQIDVSKALVYLRLTAADIFVVQEQLNRKVSDITFNLEADDRDAAEFTIDVTGAPLTLVLDDICKTFHAAWSFDHRNRAVNIYPADRKRYGF